MQTINHLCIYSVELVGYSVGMQNCNMLPINTRTWCLLTLHACVCSKSTFVLVRKMSSGNWNGLVDKHCVRDSKCKFCLNELHVVFIYFFISTINSRYFKNMHSIFIYYLYQYFPIGMDQNMYFRWNFHNADIVIKVTVNINCISESPVVGTKIIYPYKSIIN